MKKSSKIDDLLDLSGYIKMLRTPKKGGASADPIPEETHAEEQPVVTTTVPVSPPKTIPTAMTTASTGASLSQDISEEVVDPDWLQNPSEVSMETVEQYSLEQRMTLYNRLRYHVIPAAKEFNKCYELAYHATEYALEVTRELWILKQ